MEGKEEGRIFVGGLSWQTDERKLQDAFARYGKVVDAQQISRDGMHIYTCCIPELNC